MRLKISIHALRVEGDDAAGEVRESIKISIHALRVEGDQSPTSTGDRGGDFNPRPPCGGRPLLRFLVGCPMGFQSTPSVWRATQPTRTPRAPRRISIHALRVEGDLKSHIGFSLVSQVFQSTPSVWRATPDARRGG